MITDNFLKAISDIKLNELHSSFSTIHKNPLSFGAFNFGPYDLAITSLEFHKNDNFHEYHKERLSLRFSIQSGRTKYWGSLGLDLYYDDQIQFSLNEFFEGLKNEEALCDFDISISRIWDKNIKKGKFTAPVIKMNENCIMHGNAIFHQHIHQVIKTVVDTKDIFDISKDDGSYEPSDYDRHKKVKLAPFSPEEEQHYFELSLDKYVGLIKPIIHLSKKHGLIFGSNTDFYGTNYNGGSISYDTKDKVYAISVGYYNFDKFKNQKNIPDIIKAKYLKNNKWDFGDTQNDVFTFFKRLNAEISNFLEEVRKNDDILS